MKLRVFGGNRVFGLNLELGAMAMEMKGECERCGRELPSDSMEAMICSYECTFCEDCAYEVFNEICPNCGGELRYRPPRKLADESD